MHHYAERCITIQKALWNKKQKLSVERGSYRDGGEWSTTVQPFVDETLVTVESITVPEILDRFHLTCIDILKIDIEGAEKILFSEGDHKWLDQVHIIAIELHDKECSDEFYNAIKYRNGRIERDGEVTVWYQSM